MGLVQMHLSGEIRLLISQMLKKLFGPASRTERHGPCTFME